MGKIFSKSKIFSSSGSFHELSYKQTSIQRGRIAEHFLLKIYFRPSYAQYNDLNWIMKDVGVVTFFLVTNMPEGQLTITNAAV